MSITLTIEMKGYTKISDDITKQNILEMTSYGIAQLYSF